MKVVFGVTSALVQARVVEQICQAVGDEHQVLVHHDYSKQPDFALSSRNARLIEDPVRTDWGGWGFVQSILKLMTVADAQLEFDYFQLLSDSCLPIKPVSEFAAFLERERPDATFEAMPLDDRLGVALLNYGYCFYPRNRVEKTVMRRLARRALMPPDSAPRLERGGLALDAQRPPGLAANAATLLHGLLVSNARRTLPLDGDCVYCGATWFGISRRVLRDVLGDYRRSPALAQHFVRAQISDEGFFPTLIMRARPAKILGFNHYVRWSQRRTGPNELAMSDLDALRTSEKFFARKFPKDPDSEVRRRVLSDLLQPRRGG